MVALDNSQSISTSQVNKGILLVDGEKEALEGTKTVYFQLKAERNFVEGSADQMHFRLAESQFYRLMSGNQTYVNNVSIFDGFNFSLTKY